MIIRPFRPEDEDACVACGKRFHEESLYSDIAMNENKLRNLFRTAFNNPSTHLFLLYEKDGEIVGGFMAFVAPYYFSNELIAQDILWYIDKQDRGAPRMASLTMKYYRRWADALGVREAVVATSSGIEIERTAQLLEHLKFKQVGTVHKYRPTGE